MKLIVVLYVTAVLVGLSHAAYTDADQVKDEVQAYIYEHVGSMRVPMMRGGSSSQVCYNAYLPQINEILETSKTESEEIISNAETKEKEELDKYDDQRNALQAEVDALTASLDSCAAESDLLQYLNCLQTNADNNLAAIEKINADSKALYEKLESIVAEIEKEKNDGIESAISKAKEDTDAVFDALQDCLINGYQPPSPAPSPSPAPDTTPESSTDEQLPEEQDERSI